MRYDDRLRTVLGQPAMDSHGRAVQWRQLVELVARGNGTISPELRGPALERIDLLMPEVPADIVAAAARAIAGPQVPVDLIALFAARGANAAAALVTAAELDQAGRAMVRAAATADLLPLIGSEEQRAVPVATRAPPEPEPQPVPAPSPKVEAMPTGLFRWECGPTGEIDWVEGVPRAALIGKNLTEPFAERFAARLPFSDESLVLAEEGVLAGEWHWTGSPAFFPDTGRFAGYRGMARRKGAAPETGPAPAALPQDDDLRELMHELRTPLNAIIGFGEIIEGQYLGPAHRAYRARAATIVAAARRLAEAVDNLDLAAKLRSGRFVGERAAPLEIVRAAVSRARQEAEGRSIQLGFDDRLGLERVALPASLADRLVHQLAATLIEVAADGERVAAVLDRIGDQLALGFERPAALRGFSEEQLLSGGDLPGSRFALRLVQGLAAMVGGRLDIAADRLVLILPLAPE